MIKQDDYRRQLLAAARTYRTDPAARLRLCRLYNGANRILAIEGRLFTAYYLFRTYPKYRILGLDPFDKYNEKLLVETRGGKLRFIPLRHHLYGG